MKIVWLGVLALASCRGEPSQPATAGSAVTGSAITGSAITGEAVTGEVAGSAVGSVDGCAETIAAALAKIPVERWSSEASVAPAEPPLLLVAETVGYDPETSAVRLKALRGWMVKRGVATTNACKDGAGPPTIVAAEYTTCSKHGEPARHEGSGKVFHIYPQRCAGTILWINVVEGTILAQASAAGVGAVGATDTDATARQAAERELHAALDKIVTPWMQPPRPPE